jgi:N-acetylmuramoyl-L-alanine amidase CwlA
MRKMLTGLGACVALAAGLQGCGGDASPIKESITFGGTPALLTSADVRATYVTELELDKDGKQKPRKRILCAEPTPDVVKVFSASTSASIALAGSLPNGVSPEAALAFSRSHAEAAAQLGERLATIQLLRDGTYRACEAYANGAINEVGYAAILSRYDDTMVTMLLGEIAGGAFGRELATLSSTANGNARAGLDRDQSRDSSLTIDQTRNSNVTRVLEQRLGETQRAADTAQAELARETAKDPKSQSSEEIRRLEQKLDETRKEERTLNEKLKLVLEANAESAATATANPGIGLTTVTAQADVAGKITDLARKYLENINGDAVAMTCLNEMATKRNPSATPEAVPALTKFCETALEQLREDGHDLLVLLKERATEAKKGEQEAANIGAMLSKVKRQVDAAQQVKAALAGKVEADPVMKALDAFTAAEVKANNLKTEKATLTSKASTLTAELVTLKQQLAAAQAKEAELRGKTDPASVAAYQAAVKEVGRAEDAIKAKTEEQAAVSQRLTELGVDLPRAEKDRDDKRAAWLKAASTRTPAT